MTIIPQTIRDRAMEKQKSSPESLLWRKKKEKNKHQKTKGGPSIQPPEMSQYLYTTQGQDLNQKLSPLNGLAPSTCDINL